MNYIISGFDKLPQIYFFVSWGSYGDDSFPEIFSFDFSSNDNNRRLLPSGYTNAISCRHYPGLFGRSPG